MHKYKAAIVSAIETDPLTKHSPSFFAYDKYDRLYKFFQTRDYFELEKHYSTMSTLDVAKCFDSIYTHCLSWALKDKEFTKSNVSVKSTFGQEFDALMQHANHGETNGIIIGPEVSRIFAELMFQSTDRRVIAELERASDKVFGQHYVFRRYVDDVFIFSNDDATADLVYECYSDHLTMLNLHVNSAKASRICRPFITKKSRVINEVSWAAEALFRSFLQIEGDGRRLTPLAIP